MVKGSGIIVAVVGVVQVVTGDDVILLSGGSLLRLFFDYRILKSWFLYVNSWQKVKAWHE